MYYLLAVSILLASFNSIGLSKAKIGENGLIFNFNIITSFIWCVILFFVSGCSPIFNTSTIQWGVLYGTIQAMFVLFKALALKNGPVSVTTLIGNCSLIFSVAVSMIIWNEKISILQVLGIVLLLFSIVLCTYKKSDTDHNPKWKFYVILFCFFAGCVGIVFKAFSKYGKTELTNDMMFVSAVIMTVCYIVIGICNKSLKPFVNPENKANFIVFSVITSILSCLYNRLNIFLSGKMAAVIFFPGFNGGVVLFSLALSIFICKEKLNSKQIAGLILGTFAICIISIF